MRKLKNRVPSIATCLKTVYNGFTYTHTVVLFENTYLYIHVLNKNENIINTGYWVLPENGKK